MWFYDPCIYRYFTDIFTHDEIKVPGEASQEHRNPLGRCNCRLSKEESKEAIEPINDGVSPLSVACGGIIRAPRDVRMAQVLDFVDQQDGGNLKQFEWGLAVSAFYH